MQIVSEKEAREELVSRREGGEKSEKEVEKKLDQFYERIDSASCRVRIASNLAAASKACKNVEKYWKKDIVTIGGWDRRDWWSLREVKLSLSSPRISCASFLHTIPVIYVLSNYTHTLSLRKHADLRVDRLKLYLIF